MRSNLQILTSKQWMFDFESDTDYMYKVKSFKEIKKQTKRMCTILYIFNYNKLSRRSHRKR